MEQRTLGRTGLKVGVLGFGCGDVGGLIVRGTPAERERAVSRALEAGTNYFDTAASYGNGESERNLGVTLRALGVRPYIGTKVRVPPEDPDTAGAITRGVEASLQRLGMDSVDLVQRLNELAGKHGVGRIDMVEDRLVGIKSREIYEAPAAVLLHQAHRALETLVLTKEALRFKAQVGREYAELVYNGLWFSAHHQDLAAYVRSTQRFVTGEVRVRLDRGSATVAGRRSPHSLYSTSLATYGKGDAFDHRASEGFIRIFGLPLRTQARTQALWGEGSEASLDIPRKALTAPKKSSKKPRKK